MAGWGTGLRGWDWCSPGLWHRGDSRCSAEAECVLQDPLGSARAITRPARGWGGGGGRKGPHRGRDLPLSEDEEEMERESSSSCRSACQGGCG